jgi:hypothetical protein
MKTDYEDQWNITDDPDMNLRTFAHITFVKVPKAYDGEKIASSTNVAGESGYL